jgi:hypothetical protein
MQVLEWQAEAKKETEKRTLVEAILCVLDGRFATAIPAELEARIQSTEDPTQLRHWLRAAAAAPSLEAFCHTVNL